ncbi:hypothetical protein TH24_15490 [Thalassospira xiamenensis]|nr:hypothetical protein TH24_15490 [Thalassospira xiamenensis]
MGPLVIGQDGRGAPCWQGSRRNCDRQRLAATGRIGQQVANSGGRWVFWSGSTETSWLEWGVWSGATGATGRSPSAVWISVFVKRGTSAEGASAAKFGGTTRRRQHGRITAGCVSSGGGKWQNDQRGEKQFGEEPSAPFGGPKPAQGPEPVPVERIFWRVCGSPDCPAGWEFWQSFFWEPPVVTAYLENGAKAIMMGQRPAGCFVSACPLCGQGSG